MGTQGSTAVVAYKSVRVLVAVGCAFAIAGCGVFAGDDSFTLTVTNDTQHASIISEPCPGCAVSATPIVTLNPGEQFSLLVHADGGSETYLVSDQRSGAISCLPISYRKIPPQGPARGIVLSDTTVSCPGG